MATDFSQYTTPEEFANAMTALETGDPADAQLREEMFRYAAGGNVPGFYSNGQEITQANPYTVDVGGQQVAYNEAFAAPTPAPTGNTAVDQANILSNILNNPLYTEAIKGAYLEDYLPGLTQANYEINAARAQEVKDSVRRQQAQADAIRQIAGSYAARGMRTPEMTRRGFAPVQRDTAAAAEAAQNYIDQLVSNADVLYGAGSTSLDLAGKSTEEIQKLLDEQFGGSFMDNPTAYGSVGAGARRDALAQLQSLPTNYGLTQVENAPTSPIIADDTATATPDSGATGTPTTTEAAPTTTQQTSYKIKPGDTLTKIAAKYGTSVSRLAELNKIQNPNLIYAGKTLQIG